jgi:hypothetical protein
MKVAVELLLPLGVIGDRMPVQKIVAQCQAGIRENKQLHSWGSVFIRAPYLGDLIAKRTHFVQ